MNKLILTVAVLFLFTNSFAQQFSPKQGGHCFTMDLPDYLTISYDLNDVATLQYQNVSKDAYVLAIDDSKDHLEFLGLKFVSSKDFLEDFVAEYKKDAENRKQSEIKNFEANGNKHSQVELTWKYEEIDYFMLITAVETPKYFYKVLCWTIKENKDKLVNDFVKISASLKD